MTTQALSHHSRGIPTIVALPPQWSTGMDYVYAQQTITLSANSLYASQVYLNDWVRIDRIGVFVTSGGGNLRLGIYALERWTRSLSDTDGLRPGALLYDFGTVVAAAGTTEITIDVWLPPGLYAFAVHAQSGITVRAVTQSYWGTTQADSVAFASGFPTPWTTNNTSLDQAMPVVAARVADVRHAKAFQREPMTRMPMDGEHQSLLQVDSDTPSITILTTDTNNLWWAMPFRTAQELDISSVALRLTAVGAGSTATIKLRRLDPETGTMETVYTFAEAAGLATGVNTSTEDPPVHVPPGQYVLTILFVVATSSLIIRSTYAGDALFSTSIDSYPMAGVRAGAEQTLFQSATAGVTAVPKLWMSILQNPSNHSPMWRQNQFHRPGYTMPIPTGTLPMYIGPQGVSINLNTQKIGLVGGKIYAAPIIIERHCDVININVAMSAAGAPGDVAEIGMYTDNGAFYPDQLIFKATGVDLSLGGSPGAIPTDIKLVPGLYWMAFNATTMLGAAELRAGQPKIPHLAVANTDNQDFAGYTVFSADLPQTFPAGATAGDVGRMALRARMT